jgi:glyoxalase family protein
MVQPLKGIHHVTAITSSAEENYRFFTYVLGMRLVKKTVNQDDINTYHLFFTDDKGSPGTDMTFFDFQGIPKGRHGTNEIERTGFRVPTDEALAYWEKRFDHYDVKHGGVTEQFGKKVINFVDFDDQYYQLISDQQNSGVKGGEPWKNSPVPDEYQIIGLGPIHITIEKFDFFKKVLTEVLGFTLIDQADEKYLFEVGEGGNGAQVLVRHVTNKPDGRQGYGTVHHVAFRVEDREALDGWIDYLPQFGFRTSGYVDRFFFESLYARVAPQILFEWATDGPGFLGDEPYETLGEKLSLPPFLEPKRDEIEQIVRPIDTKRSDKTIEKEYF